MYYTYILYVCVPKHTVMSVVFLADSQQRIKTCTGIRIMIHF